MNTIHLSAEDFIKVLQGQSDVTHQIDSQECHIVVEENVVIDSHIQFDEDVEIDNVTCKNITIKEATFQKTVSIKDGTFQNFTIEDTSLKNFEIYKGDFNNFRIEKNRIEGYLIFRGGSFNGLLSLNNNELVGHLAIVGGTYLSNVMIGNNDTNQILIEGGEFKEGIILRSENTAPDLTCIFHGGVFHSEFNIFQTRFNLLEVNCQFFNLRLDGIYAKECRFVDVDYPLNIYGCLFESLSFGKVVTSNGKVAVDNCKIDRLLLGEFVNDGYVRINNLVPINASESQIIFIKSVLGKMVLSGLSFSSYSKIIIDNCKLDSVDTLLEPFPVSDKVYTDREGGRDLQKLSEVYKQLYFSAKSRGDRVNEISYYAEYMEAYRQHLERTKKDWANRAVLYVNKWSTNYGQDWGHGVWTILGISLVLYFFYCLCYCALSPEVTFGIEHFTYSNLSFYAVKYVEFLNPVHRIDFMNGDLPDFGSALIDLLARIVISTLIYQTIVAFRRLGKF